MPLPGRAISAKGRSSEFASRRKFEGTELADNQTDAGGHPDMDYAEHQKTYDLFIAMTKWSVISMVVVLVLMAWFLL